MVISFFILAMGMEVAWRGVGRCLCTMFRVYEVHDILCYLFF